MNIFEFRKDIVKNYTHFVESFLNIRDERIRKFVHDELGKGAFWPDPLIQLNPVFHMGHTVSDLADEGLLHPLCRDIFRTAKGGSISLYAHQEKAIRIAQKKEPYVLTTGTGSGKSLAYIIPIVDHILKNDPDAEQVRAIVVYPMNALINSQTMEFGKLLDNLGANRNKIRVEKYTGQEDPEERDRIQKHPPHVILTNYVMLELMMSRPRERIFVEQSLANLDFLVLDELHTYTGRQGSDVAMLVRRVRQRCGNLQILCIGTSATMSSGVSPEEDRKAVASAASRLFGAAISTEHVIDETLDRSIPIGKTPSVQELKASIQHEIPPQTGSFIQNPLAGWLEESFGLDTSHETLRRRKPISISEGARKLAETTGEDSETCRSTVQTWLHQGSVLKHTDGRPVFAVRLHQFFSQGDAVYATLESPHHREFTLDAQYYAADKNGLKRYWVPIAFCRECGQEYYQVYFNEKTSTWEPRPWEERGEFSDDSKIGFYFAIDHPEQSLWSDERIDELPDNWFRYRGDNKTLDSKKRPFLPFIKHAGSDGNVTDQPSGQSIPVWAIRKPLLICPRCSTIYDKRTSEFRKLTRLSSEGRSTATTLLGLTIVDRLIHEKDVDVKAQKLLSFTDNRQDASLQAGHFNDFIQTGSPEKRHIPRSPGKGESQPQSNSRKGFRIPETARLPLCTESRRAGAPTGPES